MCEALNGGCGEGAGEAFVKVHGDDVEQRSDNTDVRLHCARGWEGVGGVRPVLLDHQIDEAAVRGGSTAVRYAVFWLMTPIGRCGRHERAR